MASASRLFRLLPLPMLALGCEAAGELGTELAGGSDNAAAREACCFEAGDRPSWTSSDEDLAGLQEKIDHIVIIVQENRSFDHLFSHEPRVRARCPAEDSDCIEGYGAWRDRLGGLPFHASATNQSDVGHDWSSMHGAWNGGAMDNFYAATGGHTNRVLQYYLPQDHPFYSWLLAQFASSDSHFAPMLGPTFPNRDYLTWGSAFGMTANSGAPPHSDRSAGPSDEGIFRQLEERGIRWRLYWSGSSGHAIDAPYEGALGWNQPDGPRMCAHPGAESVYCTTPRDAFEQDVDGGRLPAVAFYETGDDEHPGDSDIHGGEQDVRHVIDKLMRSAAWPRTLVLLTYDEGGGYFDHASPPVGCDEFSDFAQRGMRVPLLAISAYARPGYVSHTTSDHASILRLIQARWDLPALSMRNANASALLDLFDFAAPPAPPPGLLPNAAAVGDGPSDHTLALGLWNDEVPQDTTPSLPGAFEVGVKFASRLEHPRVVAVKYWVGAAPEIGVVHLGHVWDASDLAGPPLATVRFAPETAQTANRWQTAYLDLPLAITPGHIYLVSRNTRFGGLPKTLSYFEPAVHPALPRPSPRSPTVFTCQRGSTCDGLGFGVNGVFGPEGAVPSTDPGGTNYWVDVLVKN